METTSNGRHGNDVNVASAVYMIVLPCGPTIRRRHSDRTLSEARGDKMGDKR